MNKCITIILALFLAGCSTVNPADVVTPPECKRVAVCVGLTSVNPSAYNGWAGDCPGCDVDAKGMYQLFTRNGIDTVLCLNKDATWGNVKSIIRNVTKNFGKDDLLIVMMSGHGGQVPDTSGDEADKLDETLCLWDGQVIDDKVLEFICTLPPMRIALINDQCHAEGNWRTFIRAVTFGKFGKTKGRGYVTKIRGWQGQIIQFAMCREASYSYGTESGGTGSQSMLSVQKNTLSWIGWFNATKKKMPSSQVPVFVTFQASDSFINGKVMK
jgi:hypothetical protein